MKNRRGEEIGIPSREGFQWKSRHPLIDSNISNPFQPKIGRKKIDVSTLSIKW